MRLLAYLLLAATLASPACRDRSERVRQEKALAKTEILLQHLGQELDTYFIKTRERPATLGVLVDAGTISADQVVDSWGEPLRYESTGRSYMLCSNGPDKQAGSADDLCRSSRR